MVGVMIVKNSCNHCIIMKHHYSNLERASLRCLFGVTNLQENWIVEDVFQTEVLEYLMWDQ